MTTKGKIGVQMSTVAPLIREGKSIREIFEGIKNAGYNCVEVSQIPMTEENVKEMKSLCEELGMEIASLSAAVEPMIPGQKSESLATDYDKIVADCKYLGVDMLRIGMLPVNCMGTKEDALGFARKANEFAKRLKEDGIDLYYHNHHVEFVQYDGQTLLDLIRENAPDLGFELDIHWIQRGGANPVEVIKDYAGKIRLLHLKDYRIGQLVLPEDMSQFMQAFAGIVEFAEVGEGSLPVKECIEEGLKGGSEYFLVEQDNCYGRDPLESLKISHDNLVEMGYADWF